MALLSVLFFLAFGYAAVMIAYLLGWHATPVWQMPQHFEPHLTVSVVVAARNEADRILDCLDSIQNGSYPPTLLEIIVVDDFSEDDTAALVARAMEKQVSGSSSGPKMTLLRLSDLLPSEYRWTANKKKAIEIGVLQARGTIIATTDADCLAPKDWLRWLTSRFSTSAGVNIVAAPVVFHRETNLFQHFQSLDFVGLMGITGAGYRLGWHRMANGANLAYRREAFLAVGGYSGNERIASGDDMFLMQKMVARWPESAGFLKCPAATVRTEAKKSVRAFFQQRLRWGTKNAALPEWPIRLVLLLVWLFCWSISLSPAMVVAGLIPWQVPVFQLVIKALADWLFLSEMCRYFGRKDLLRWFAPSFFCHIGYLALVGLFSLFLKKYTWKGRKVAA